MGCTATKVTAIDISPEKISPKGLREVKSSKGVPQSVAFEISLENGTSDPDRPSQSAMKSQPPRRLQKLITVDKENGVTPELIAAKQAEAERRRQEVLNQRIQSARRAQTQMLHHQPRLAEELSVPGLVPEDPEDTEIIAPIEENVPDE